MLQNINIFSYYIRWYYLHPFLLKVLAEWFIFGRARLLGQETFVNYWIESFNTKISTILNKPITNAIMSFRVNGIVMWVGKTKFTNLHCTEIVHDLENWYA